MATPRPVGVLLLFALAPCETLLQRSPKIASVSNDWSASPAQSLVLRPERRRAPHPIMGNPVPFSTRLYLKQTEKKKLMDLWVAQGVPRWVTLVDEFLFLVASVIFLIGSFDFYPGTPFVQYVQGCQLFIVGSMIYLVLAVFAAFEIVSDSRLASRPPDTSELLEQFLYLVGSALFLVRCNPHTRTHLASTSTSL